MLPVASVLPPLLCFSFVPPPRHHVRSGTRRRASSRTRLTSSPFQARAVPARAPPERVGVSAHDFRLMAVWILIVLPYSPDLALCASAGEGGLAALARCTTLDALQAGKLHYKLARESDVAGNYLHDPRCGLQALTDANWSADVTGFCAASRGVGGQAREGVG
ncbi:hypothetical protein FB451DRAFT_1496166 [Mycena latifolia]|nr:hypothetical protein FB451DRAFT_1496166 [Mycena latifolia]